MKRRLIWISVIIIVVGTGLAAWFLAKPLLFPSPSGGPSTQPGQTGGPVVKPALSNDYYSAINLYMAGPDDAEAGISRVELTLAKAEITRGDGKTFKIFEGATKLVLQKNVSEKLLNELLPAGPYGTLTLTFLPTGTIVAADGSAQSAFLPNRTLVVEFKEDLDQSRTLTGLARLDLAAARFGVQSDVPTYILPAKLTAESYVLGGIFRNTHGVGGIWNLTKPDLAAEVKQDLHLDITPTAKTGTPSYNAPTAPPNPTAPNR